MGYIRVVKLCIASAAVITPTAAFGKHITLDRPTTGAVVVWETRQAAQKGMGMMQAGLGADLIAPLTRCVVANGTRAYLVRDYGYFKEVLVTEGEFRGCEGFVHPGDLR